jgi:hypothetical protein
VVNTIVTVEEPFDECLVINIDNDFFAENLTTDMFTLSGILSDAVVTNVEKVSGNQSVRLTVKGQSMRSAGQGTVTVSGEGTETGRSVSGTVYVIEPQIMAFHSLQNDTADGYVYEIYSIGEDFEKYISAGDFVLKDAVSNLTINSVEWISGSHVRLTAKGTISDGDGTISIRSAAMGCVTGAETKICETGDLTSLGIGVESSTSSDEMSGQTGSFGLDAILDWGYDKIKEKIVEKIQNEVDGKIDEGLDFLLGAVGLTGSGASVEEMLAEIQTSLDDLNTKVSQMQAQLSAQLQSNHLDNRLALLLDARTRISNAYDIYEDIAERTEAYKKNPPSADRIQKLQNDIQKLAGTGGLIETSDIKGAVMTIANSMSGNGVSSLITEYFAFYKTVYPFEHNSVSKLMELVADMNMIQSKGALLYAEYCNYINDPDLLRIFNKSWNASIDTQISKLPQGYEMNIRNVWGSPNSCDIKIKCNQNGKTYIIVGDTFTMGQCIIPGNAWDTNNYMDINHGIINTIYYNRGINDNLYGLITSSDVTALFSCRDNYYTQTPASTFFDMFAANNGIPPYGWLYTNDNPEYKRDFWGLTGFRNIHFYNLFSPTSNSYIDYNTYDLYHSFNDSLHTAKFILVQR